MNPEQFMELMEALRGIRFGITALAITVCVMAMMVIGALRKSK